MFLLLARENLTSYSSCNRSCLIPHDTKKRAAVPFVLHSVRSSTHFTSHRMYLVYGGGRLLMNLINDNESNYAETSEVSSVILS